MHNLPFIFNAIRLPLLCRIKLHEGVLTLTKGFDDESEEDEVSEHDIEFVEA
jgi:hypothetical protein